MKSIDILKAFKVFVDKDGILNLHFLRDIAEPAADILMSQLIENEILKILNKDPGKIYNALVDLSFEDRSKMVTSKSRKTYIRVSQHKQLDKIAIVGGSVFIRTVAGFILQTAGKSKKMKWFNNKEKALKWLKKKFYIVKKE